MITVEPLAVTKSDAFRVIGMPKLVQRWLHHGWVEIVRQGGRGCETVIDYQSLKAAYERFKRGEEPPPLPSEIKQGMKTKANPRQFDESLQG